MVTFPKILFASQPVDMQDIIKNSHKHYDTWIVARYFSKSRDTSGSEFDGQCIPSFSATNSMLQAMLPKVTTATSTPIIPHPANEYDTINTTMKNYQDVLMQNNLQYGPLWSDEGVYRLAKELQLLNPDDFSNTFLGLGGFHMEKVVIACCGKFLENVGIDSVLVENEVFGPAVIYRIEWRELHSRYTRNGDNF